MGEPEASAPGRFAISADRHPRLDFTATAPDRSRFTVAHFHRIPVPRISFDERSLAAERANCRRNRLE